LGLGAAQAFFEGISSGDRCYIPHSADDLYLKNPIKLLE
jgi:hypothetical protein